VVDLAGDHEADREDPLGHEGKGKALEGQAMKDQWQDADNEEEDECPK